jgi:hypothetical protein
MITVSIETLHAIMRTWQQLGGDGYDAADGDNEIAVELVLDANRLSANGESAAEEEIHTLCMEHGFGHVRSAVAEKLYLL